ncbi:ABC transporter permease subunit [Anaerosalibacter massiliensis]
MILVFPLSKLIVGSTIGTTATIVPLSIAAAPFVARVIETALKEVDGGIIEASLSMGATVPQIVFKVLIPEAMPSLIMGVTLTIINLIGYSAMAGAIGGGGLGDLAIRYGLYRFETNIMITSVIIIIILVQGIQILGNKLAISIDKK